LCPSYPRYLMCPTVCVNNNDCATVHVMHVREKKMQADIITMNTALANIFLQAMSSQVCSSFQQPRLHKPNIVFVNLFLWFLNQYGKTTAKDCEANRQRMVPVGTPLMGSMPSSSASSWELHTPAVRASG
jgi:hypothetical protein